MLQLDGWICKDPREVAKPIHQARISAWKKANTSAKRGWVGVWAGLDTGSSLPRITVIWPDFKHAIQAKSPPSLPAHTRGGVVGFQSWLTHAGTRLVHIVLVGRVGGGDSTSPSADGKVGRERQGPTKAGSV